MKTTEGKLGRIFMIHLEDGDEPAASIERFAVEKGIMAAQVFLVAGDSVAGIIMPDADGTPRLRLAGGTADAGKWADGDIVVQEFVGVHFRRVRDPESGRESVAKVPGTKTRVMEKPAPSPEDTGPGTVPVYLFNVEFN